MVTLRWLTVFLVACGRINFDPLGGGSAAGDATGDGVVATGDGSVIDAVPAACAEAIAVQLGTVKTISTCFTGFDRMDACGPAGVNEVVFSFTVPTTAGYTIRAYDPGTMNVSNTTGVVNTTCTGTLQCAGIIGQAYTAGQMLYFVVEASAGGCATIDFLITQP